MIGDSTRYRSAKAGIYAVTLRTEHSGEVLRPVAEDFVPIGAQEGWASIEGPFEGVPPHLLTSLIDWIEPIFYQERRTSHGSIRYNFQHHVLQEAERRLRFSSGISRASTTSNADAWSKLRGLLSKKPETLLQIIDFVLWSEDVSTDARTLQTLLIQGGSVYHVAETTGRPRLERRVEATAEQVARGEMKRGGAPSHLLQAAWSKTFGLEPSPSEGYRNAVRAVEAAAVQVVLPNDPSATLGKVIGHLAGGREQWDFTLPRRRDGAPSVQTVIDAMGALWTSQYDRHVTEGAPLHIGQEEAEAALPLAATLVHWLRTGALRKP